MGGGLKMPHLDIVVLGHWSCSDKNNIQEKEINISEKDLTMSATTCLHHHYGHCKFGEQCCNVHVTETCDSRVGHIISFWEVHLKHYIFSL